MTAHLPHTLTPALSPRFEREPIDAKAWLDHLAAKREQREQEAVAPLRRPTEAELWARINECLRRIAELEKRV